VDWEWTVNPDVAGLTDSMAAPIVVNLTDDNGDGVVDERDIPEVVLIVFNDDGPPDSRIVAVDGLSGSMLWMSPPSHNDISAFVNLAAGDIDLDGLPEIIGASRIDGDIYLIALEDDGSFKWLSEVTSNPVNVGGAPALADLDADSVPEIVFGRNIFDNAGQLICTGGRGQGGTLSPASLVADLDLDGVPEIVAGNTAYRDDCSIYWDHAWIGDGYSALGNFDDDPYPEIVVVDSGSVWLLEHDGSVVWREDLAGDAGGCPCVGDVDQDGVPEISVSFRDYLYVLDSEGGIVWSARIDDTSSGFLGSTMFDFDGDCRLEVVHADQHELRIYDGTTGDVLWSAPNSSNTMEEMPVVADVDGDDHAEIVQVANRVAGGIDTGVRAFGDPKWIDARHIWNQHSYHVGNVNDDATIPPVDPNSWSGHNTYRVQAGRGGAALSLVRGLRGRKLLDAAEFVWEPAIPDPPEYHLNGVAIKVELLDPTVNGNGVTECVAAGAELCTTVPYTSLGVRFYQVLSACGGTEGPF
jgi:hypothetical protein